MKYDERMYHIAKIRALVAEQSQEAFLLFDVALCGHMTPEGQTAFIKDVINRGLYVPAIGG